MKKTLRLTYPQWQGGMNPDYVFGAELLERIAPPSATAEHAAVMVNRIFDLKESQLDGIDCSRSRPLPRKIF